VSFALLAFSRRWLLLAALIILPPTIVIIVGPMIALPREYVTSTPCASHQRQLAIAIIMYAQDHGDRLPSSFADLTEYRDAPRIFDCPPGHGAFTRGGFGYNASLFGLKRDIADPAALIVTADSIEPNMLMRSEDDIAWKRHGNGCNLSFLDGHTKWHQAENGPLFIPIRMKP
jgi:prepilin-type processing-associated H-X9-DG protein